MFPQAEECRLIVWIPNQLWILFAQPENTNGNKHLKVNLSLFPAECLTMPNHLPE